jgi:FAD binding domain-containing protein
VLRDGLTTLCGTVDFGAGAGPLDQDDEGVIATGSDRSVGAAALVRAACAVGCKGGRRRARTLVDIPCGGTEPEP